MEVIKMTMLTASEARIGLYKLLDKAAESHEPIQITGKRHNAVLIAEDDFLVVEMVRGLLRELGHTLVDHAVNGREAVEMTQQLLPDVVLMDIKMPVMDGIEATRHIQEECPTPVVVLTAHESPGLVRQVSQDVRLGKGEDGVDSAADKGVKASVSG